MNKENLYPDPTRNKKYFYWKPTYEFMVDFLNKNNELKIGCEIGVAGGQNMKHILKNCSHIQKMFGVDSYSKISWDMQDIDIDKEFNETLTNNIVKVVIDKNISTEHLDALVSKMNVFKPNDLRIDYDVNYNKIKVDDKVELDLSGVIIEKAIDEFVNMLDIQNKSEVIEYTINLYNRSKL